MGCKLDVMILVDIGYKINSHIYIYVYVYVCVYVYIYIRICKTCLKCNRSASSQSDRTSRPIITISLISSPHDLPVHSSSSTIHYSFPRIHNHVRNLYMSLGFKRRIPYQDSQVMKPSIFVQKTTHCGFSPSGTFPRPSLAAPVILWQVGKFHRTISSSFLEWPMYKVPKTFHKGNDLELSERCPFYFGVGMFLSIASARGCSV